MWHHSNILLLLLLHPIQLYFAQQASFPNPRANGFSECGLKSKGYVCDPYKQLTEQERYRLNNDLLQLSRRTSDKRGGGFCATKGVDATLFITRQGNERLAHELKNRWAVDGQCKKSVVFVLSTNDRKLYYAADDRSPISQSNFERLVSEQQQLLNEGRYTMALTTIFMKLGQSIHDKERMNINDRADERDLPMGAPQVNVHSYFTIISSIALYLLAT